MIYGIGVDVCSVNRMKQAISKKGFCARIFSEEEINYADSKCNPEYHYAAAYAAKEAFIKATGMGMAKTGIRGIFVSRTDNGPVFKLGKTLQEKLDSIGPIAAHLSISHDDGVAVAFVVLERTEQLCVK